MSQLFITLGNDRPPILIRLEDEVLQAVIAISQGKSRQDVMQTLHSQLESLEKDLAADDRALNWFNLPTAPASISSTPPPSEVQFTPPVLPNMVPPPAYDTVIPNTLQEKFKG